MNGLEGMYGFKESCKQGAIHLDAPTAPPDLIYLFLEIIKLWVRKIILPGCTPCIMIKFKNLVRVNYGYKTGGTKNMVVTKISNIFLPGYASSTLTRNPHIQVHVQC